MRTRLVGGSLLLLLLTLASCQDLAPPTVTPEPSPTPSPSPSALAPQPARTVPPNLFVQPARVYTYRRTLTGANSDGRLIVTIGALQDQRYDLAIRIDGPDGKRSLNATQSVTRGLFPFTAGAEGVPTKNADEYPKESVSVPAGPFEAWKVETVTGEGPGTYWYSTAYGVPVKWTQAIAGGTETVELMGAEPSRYRLHVADGGDRR